MVTEGAETGPGPTADEIARVEEANRNMAAFGAAGELTDKERRAAGLSIDVPAQEVTSPPSEAILSPAETAREQAIAAAILEIQQGADPKVLERVLIAAGNLGATPSGNLIVMEGDKSGLAFYRAKVHAVAGVRPVPQAPPSEGSDAISAELRTAADIAEEVSPAELAAPKESKEEMPESSVVNSGAEAAEREIPFWANKTFNALSEKIKEVEDEGTAIKKSLASKVYLHVVGRKDELEEHLSAKRRLEELVEQRAFWEEEESKLFVCSADAYSLFSELKRSKVGGVREREKLEELSSKIAEALQIANSIDLEIVPAVAQKITLAKYKGSRRCASEFAGVEVDKQDVEEEKRLIIDSLVNGRISAFVPYKDLGPEMQELFIVENDEAITAMASAVAEHNKLKEALSTGLTPENIHLNSGSVADLLETYMASMKKVESLKKSIFDSIESSKRSERHQDLVKEAKKRIKNLIGNKVFATDKSGFIAEADTKFDEIVLNGRRGFIEAIAKARVGISSARAVENRGKHTLKLARKAFNDAFSSFIPESENARAKSEKLQKEMEELDVTKAQIDETIDYVLDLRRVSEKREEKIVTDALVESEAISEEKRIKVVKKIVSGMIDMVLVPYVGSVKEQLGGVLQKRYEEEGLSDVFLGLLLEKYQKAKYVVANREREKIKKERKSLELERKKLNIQREKAIDSATEALINNRSRALDKTEREVARLEEGLVNRLAGMDRDIRLNVRNLEDRIERELYYSLLEKLT